MSLKITQPTLVVDKQKALTNIKRMADKAKASNCVFRPHLKTPQSIKIANWYKQFGVKKVTVSSLKMAQYFASDGWDDITIAFPVNILEITEIDKLAADVQLNILIESLDTLKIVTQNLTNKVGIFIKVDTGYGRTGIDWKNHQLISTLANQIKKHSQLDFIGILCHAGHSYNARGKNEINNIYVETIERMLNVKLSLLEQHPNVIVSIGDTPSCSIAKNFNQVDEIRPGNFIFYDLVQQQIGSCNYQDIAVAMYCPIVAIHLSRNELIIHGGGIHFSKDYLIHDEFGKIYGLVVSYQKDGKSWANPRRGYYLSRISQEHGVVKYPPSSTNNFKVGDIVTILPVHSCMAINLAEGFLSTDGEWLAIG